MSNLIGEKYEKSIDRCRNLYNTAYDCIKYVGYANYADREKAAMIALKESYISGNRINPETIFVKEIL